MMPGGEGGRMAREIASWLTVYSLLLFCFVSFWFIHFLDEALLLLHDMTK
jgi:hypothetical protein